METNSAEGISGWKRRNVVNHDLVIYYRVQSANMNEPLICSKD
jgi:hypothetical protein